MGAGIDSISDVMGSPMEVIIGDKPFKVSPLEMGDFGLAANHIRSQRLALFLEQTRGINGVNLPSDVRSQTISGILNSPLRINDIIGDNDGLLFLVFRSLARGNPGVNLEVVKKIVGTELSELTEIVMTLSGFFKKIGDGEDPLGENTTTTTT